MRPQASDHLNELTFVARLGAKTRLRYEAQRSQGLPVLIASGEIEEREIDPSTGRVLRCDMRLNSPSGQKLASGEFKRPEVPEGKDPRHEELRADARRKAIARGLSYYFTCNFSRIVLYSLPLRPGDTEREVTEVVLADISNSKQANSVWTQIEENWSQFLDYLEPLLETVVTRRPSVSHRTVVLLRQALDAIVEECSGRVRQFLHADSTRIDDARQTAANAYGLAVALNPERPALFADELAQILRLGAFVVAQKVILCRTLSEVGPKRRQRFVLDPIAIPSSSTDPELVRQVLNVSVQQAIQRSKDYETAFLPTPHEDLLFCPVLTDVEDCRVGAVWAHLANVVEEASWTAISQNLVGFLYETIIAPRFRRELGQYYTRIDVVDILTTFAVRSKDDVVLDPAAGGGSFLRSAYQRKIDMDASHEEALAEVWGCEITTFAAQLSSISLATANTEEPAAYPRVLLKDFFSLRPGSKTELTIPGEDNPLRFPAAFDAIVGNPPYISYRHQRNQIAVGDALASLGKTSMRLPAFSGKSDEYVWFIVHSARFLKAGSRLAFVVSAALLFSDYGIPLIRFVGRYFRIVAVVDSLVEQWFEDADTNTVLLFIEREDDAKVRERNEIRFIRLRQPLARLLLEPDDERRRGSLESFVDSLLSARPNETDHRFQVNLVLQGGNGGLNFDPLNDSPALPAEVEYEEEYG